MRRPGARVRTIAARLCGARTMERLVDPTLADLQAEYEDAVGRGRKWRGRRVLVRGHIALVQVVTVHGGMRAMWMLRDFTGDDRLTLLRTVGASAAIIIAGTLVLMAPFLEFVSLSQPDFAQMALYLVPQALPISMPVGLTFGILWGLGRVAASRRSRALVLLLGTMASVASFTMLAWVVPAANQAFRVSMFSHIAAQSGQLYGGSVQKGANELTLSELRQLLEPGTRAQRPVAGPSDIRSLALNYHGRWAMAATPLVLAFFAVALSSRRQWGWVMPPLAGCLAIVGYYVVMALGRDLTLSAFTAAWIPNIAFVLLSVAIITLSAQQDNKTAPA